MSRSIDAPTASLHRWLRATSVLAGLICLGLCALAVALLWNVDQSVAELTERIAGRAVPATELVRAANDVGLQVGVFTRTRTDADRLVAAAQFSKALAMFGRTRVALAGREEGQETAALIRRATPQILLWRGEVDPVHWTTGT